MEETTVSIIGILIAAVLMFIVPLILIADRTDDISQLLIQTATADFVDEVIKTGKIMDSEYQHFIARLSTSGNTYDVDIELKILDENTTKQGDNNKYYSIYTSQIEDIIGVSGESTTNNTEGKFILKQGDVISVTVRNSSKTLSQVLKSFYFGIKGTDIQIITATASGTVAINGAT